MAFKEYYILLRKEGHKSIENEGDHVADVIRHSSGAVWLVVLGAQVVGLTANQSFSHIDVLLTEYKINPLSNDKWGEVFGEERRYRYRLQYIGGA